MKKWILLIMISLLSAAPARGAKDNVFVNLEQVFSDFYKTQLAKSRVDVQQQDIEAERKIMVDELSAMETEADSLKKETRDVTLSEEIRDSKRILFEELLLKMRDKQKEIEDFADRRAKQLQVQVSRMSQTIMDEIREAVVARAQREGYTAVIDSSTRRAAIGVFIYTRSDVDITDSILAELNSKRPDDSQAGGLFDEVAEPDADGAPKEGSDTP